MANQRRQ
jgi:hypothetical protein